MTTTADLPGQTAQLWDWQAHGACRTMAPESFFHPEGERGTARRNRALSAKAVCVACPVLKQCRDHALAAREPYGIWGGMTEDERDQHHAKMRYLAS